MIRVENVTLEAGTFRLDDASLRVPTGAYGVVMGRTGSGKTTLLEAIAGLKKVRAGHIYLGDREVTHLKPAERNVGYVPQDGALFHSMNIRAHLAFALQIRRQPQSQIHETVGELATLLGLEKMLDRGIQGLSGGERQRVALGRALSYHPQTLLLDEPLSALDDATREQMYGLLKRVQSQTGVTLLHVTHSVEEASVLADIQFHFADGRIGNVSKPTK